MSNSSHTSGYRSYSFLNITKDEKIFVECEDTSKKFPYITTISKKQNYENYLYFTIDVNLLIKDTRWDFDDVIIVFLVGFEYSRLPQVFTLFDNTNYYIHKKVPILENNFDIGTGLEQYTLYSENIGTIISLSKLEKSLNDITVKVL